MLSNELLKPVGASGVHWCEGITVVFCTCCTKPFKTQWTAVCNTKHFSVLMCTLMSIFHIAASAKHYTRYDEHATAEMMSFPTHGHVSLPIVVGIVIHNLLLGTSENRLVSDAVVAVVHDILRRDHT